MPKGFDLEFLTLCVDHGSILLHADSVRYEVARASTSRTGSEPSRRCGANKVRISLAACRVRPDRTPVMASSLVVDRNHAVAVAMADGIPAGLALVDELAESGRLDGRGAEAAVAYSAAMERAPTDAT
jgi:hypothetical protein